MSANVLIVDDDDAIRRALTHRVRHWGHLAEEARDGDQALDVASRKEFDLVFLDLAMPGRSGIEVLRSWTESGYGADVVVLTAHGSIEAAVEAVRMGAADFLLKPADFGLLEAAVNRILSKRQPRSGQPGSHRTDRRFNLAGPRRLTGNERVAGARRSRGTGQCHHLAHRREREWEADARRACSSAEPSAPGSVRHVNCVALSDELIESTLFGHERGAFTGAVARKEGRLEAASGGTAFLDEVGDITPRLQTKLLHFLESSEFERVGGTRTIRVDCRVIAATNRNLEMWVKEGKFREDLYFRINVIGLRVPPLRERVADIPHLAEAFLERFARELGKGKLKIATRTSEILQRYSWPGNVRQLKNAIERMAVLARTDTLTPDLLPPEVLAPDQGPVPEPEDLPMKDAVLAFKRRHIARALARAGGNQRIAAEQLGLQRTFLNRLIKEYGL